MRRQWINCCAATSIMLWYLSNYVRNIDVWLYIEFAKLKLNSKIEVESVKNVSGDRPSSNVVCIV